MTVIARSPFATLTSKPHLVAFCAVVGSLALARWWQFEVAPGLFSSLWNPYFFALLGWVAVAGMGAAGAWAGRGGGGGAGAGASREQATARRKRPAASAACAVAAAPRARLTPSGRFLGPTG